ncbi:MAG TPA: YidC/Oxa1 family insertase periplasmic-domain containing protein [Gemmataceae bacterium]|nr:YidC/Oxa1 family insertase periplasmic-domain containing protein [Gemmataceae bacterium]
MRQNVSNIVLFVLLGAGLTALFWYADKNWIPKKPRPKKDDAGEVKKDDGRPPAEAVAAVAGGMAGVTPPAPTPAPKPIEQPKIVPPPPARSEPHTFITLGEKDSYNRLMLTTKGAGVQRVTMPMFVESNRIGRAMTDKDTGAKVPLHLISGVTRPREPSLTKDYELPELVPGKQTEARDDLAEPSYTLFHYENADDKSPVNTLGERNWRVVSEEHPAGGDHKVVFETELGDPHFIKIRKTFTLGPKDFHVGLKLEFEQLPGRQKDVGKFRYQLSGPRGLPIEGEWYTSTYRVGLIGWTDKKGAARRQYDDNVSVAAKRGGDTVSRADNTFKYAGVVTQFFASVIAIDETAEVKNPWAYARVTTELPPDKLQNINLPYFDDITVRVVSEPLDMPAGGKTTHSYVIYNGPVKIRLLKMLKDASGGDAVNPALVDRYHDYLDLRTLTDFRSPTALGRFADAIYFSDLVITFTNVMHAVLYVIHRVVPDWGVSIILLTIMVRLLLLLPSKKQTQMNLRMVEIQKKLQPEIEKLRVKHKDDFHNFNRAKTQLMMSNGLNPFAAMGGCLLLLAQMPIMMGLYFALQESIFFRLEPFLWVQNLAAPDMLVWWGETIPFVSTPADIGGFFYLGPFFNILPVLAVGLMLWQQNKMMPPPTDEQMAAQQRMMKFMMIIVAVMFYKVAAGLCLYFIVSTAWGLIERKLIPKAEDKPADAGGATPPVETNGKPATPAEAAIAAKPKGVVGRFKQRLREKMEELQKKAEEQSKRQIRNDGGPQQPPTGGGNPGQRRPPPDRRDKKKKRRK